MTAADTVNLVCLGPTALPRLRESLERTLGDQAAPLMQEAGYASGAEMFQSFRSWLSARADISDPGELDASFLSSMVSDFFEEKGWGAVTIEQAGAAALAVDATQWAEAGSETTAVVPSCHLTTGILAAFMTELAGDVVAVMQVECLTCGDNRCRFLAGSPAALQQVFETMTQGRHYSEILTTPS